jgi:hypothetical protein
MTKSVFYETINGILHVSLNCSANIVEKRYGTSLPEVVGQFRFEPYWPNLKPGLRKATNKIFYMFLKNFYRFC